jgi:hypothetical protein
MKNYSHILCLIFLTSLISCNDEFRNTNVVLAGMYKSFSVYHEFLPTLAVKTELNIATGFYEGSDSIDLNLDDNFDLIISSVCTQTIRCTKWIGGYITQPAELN